MGGDFNFIVNISLDHLNRHSNYWKARSYFVDWAAINVWLMYLDL